MIKSIKAESYKSIKKLELELGRVNVFIGENGAGKSNILEVFALAGAAVARKLDNEFLSSRGVRVTKPEYMRPAFLGVEFSCPISIFIGGDGGEDLSIKLNNDNLPYSKWNAQVTEVRSNDAVLAAIGRYHSGFRDLITIKKEHNSTMTLNFVNIDIAKAGNILDEIVELLNKMLLTKSKLTADVAERFNTLKVELDANSEFTDFVRQTNGGARFFSDLGSFIVYSPENSALRTFEREGQIEPLGINGEGLLKLLSVLSREEHSEILQEIKASLKVLGWFEDFALIEGDTISPRRITIKDRYIEENKRYFDQTSANEGFLILLFYFSLFSTNLTPKIFAIDNIDASLNPKLCEKLLRELTRLAKKHDKQVLLTTHNPATLDGLNLDDDEQRLFVVSRGKSGETRVRRLQKKSKGSETDKPIRLSEMFLKGSLGGLPKGF